MSSAFTTLARAFKGGLTPRSARAYIIPLNTFKGDEAMPGLQRSFQYFPSTITDEQATNYQSKVIPGLSHPLYQWTSGGARTITFEAIFTRDRSYSKDELGAIGGSETDRSKIQSSSDTRNADIPSAIAWLRSFLLPQYSVDGSGSSFMSSTFSRLNHPSPLPRPRPPQKLILCLPGVRINWGNPELNSDQIYCIMTQCSVTYDGFFHDGSPRMAKVQLAFAEVIQVQGRVAVHDAIDKQNVAFNSYNFNDTGTKGTDKK